MPVCGSPGNGEKSKTCMASRRPGGSVGIDRLHWAVRVPVLGSSSLTADGEAFIGELPIALGRQEMLAVRDPALLWCKINGCRVLIFQ